MVGWAFFGEAIECNNAKIARNNARVKHEFLILCNWLTFEQACCTIFLRPCVALLSSFGGMGMVCMREGSDGLGNLSSLRYIDAQTVRTLDALIERAVLSNPDGHYQLWMYAQIERGEVRQVGVSPVMGESIRFSDGGRRR